MWGISILADFTPKLWGISFHAVIVSGLGGNLLFKSVLGHCDVQHTTNTQKSSLSLACVLFPRSSLLMQRREYAVYRLCA